MDAGCCLEELLSTMADRDGWHALMMMVMMIANILIDYSTLKLYLRKLQIPFLYFDIKVFHTFNISRKKKQKNYFNLTRPKKE